MSNKENFNDEITKKTSLGLTVLQILFIVIGSFLGGVLLVLLIIWAVGYFKSKSEEKYKNKSNTRRSTCSRV